MPSPSIDPGDLLDLKLMPAWVKESSGREDYSHYEGEQMDVRPDRRDRRPRGRDKSPRQGGSPDQRLAKRPDRERRGRDDRRPARTFAPRRDQTAPAAPERPLEVTVRFVPKTVVLENVVIQVKA